MYPSTYPNSVLDGRKLTYETGGIFGMYCGLSGLSLFVFFFKFVTMMKTDNVSEQKCG